MAKEKKTSHNSSFSFLFSHVTNRLPDKIPKKLDINNPEIFRKFVISTTLYHCVYYGGNNLKVYPVTYSGRWDSPKYGKELKDSWKFFYKKADLNHLIHVLSNDLLDVGKINKSIDDNQITKALEDIIDKQTGKPAYIIPEVVPSDKVLLQLIRDYPEVLHNPDILNRFIEILKIAHWGGNVWCIKKTFEKKPQGKEILVKEEKEKISRDKIRNEACNFLKDYLIPLHPGGRKALLPDVNYKIAIELMKRLAKHLSDKFKTELKQMDYEVDDLYSSDIDTANVTHNALIKWANNNDERICMLSINKIKLLIKNPSQFVDELVKYHLQISPKTISRS
ncbi:MAG: hypothetical protein HZA00_11245 [Nitrospinae bacterium]|nr:hypothetical protein [Nitrospinota bacterium]